MCPFSNGDRQNPLSPRVEREGNRHVGLLPEDRAGHATLWCNLGMTGSPAKQTPPATDPDSIPCVTYSHRRDPSAGGGGALSLIPDSVGVNVEEKQKEALRYRNVFIFSHTELAVFYF